MLLFATIKDKFKVVDPLVGFWVDKQFVGDYNFEQQDGGPVAIVEKPKGSKDVDNLKDHRCSTENRYVPNLFHLPTGGFVVPALWPTLTPCRWLCGAPLGRR